MMKHAEHEIDRVFDEKLEALYQESAREKPAAHIDKWIIAAAHRETANTENKKGNVNSWINRFRLPVSIAATFIFAAFSTHFFWPKAVRTLPGTVSVPVKTEDSVKTEGSVKEENLLKEYTETRLLHKEGLVDKDERAVKDKITGKKKGFSQDKRADKADVRSQGATGSGELPLKDNVSGKNISKTQYLNQKEWQKKIRTLFKKGETQLAQEELARFKQRYPNAIINEK